MSSHPSAPDDGQLRYIYIYIYSGGSVEKLRRLLAHAADSVPMGKRQTESRRL